MVFIVAKDFTTNLNFIDYIKAKAVAVAEAEAEAEVGSVITSMMVLKIAANNLKCIINSKVRISVNKLKLVEKFIMGKKMW